MHKKSKADHYRAIPPSIEVRKESTKDAYFPGGECVFCNKEMVFETEQERNQISLQHLQRECGM